MGDYLYAQKSAWDARDRGEVLGTGMAGGFLICLTLVGVWLVRRRFSPPVAPPFLSPGCSLPRLRGWYVCASLILLDLRKLLSSYCFSGSFLSTHTQPLVGFPDTEGPESWTQVLSCRLKESDMSREVEMDGHICSGKRRSYEK